MLRFAWLLLTVVLVLLPVGWCLFSAADFINVGNESVAYRFFYSVRLHYAADMTAWLPQGHLITSAQNIITWLLPPPSLNNLRSLLNTFSLLSLALIASVSVGSLIVAAISQVLDWRDRILLSVVALSPIYALPSADTWLWPDYLALDATLAVPCVLLFQLEWRGPPRGPFASAVFYGVFAGTVAANKISMIVIIFPLLVTALSRGTVRSFVIRGIIATASLAIAFSFWFFAAGLFRIDWLMNVLPNWWHFVLNPGVEAGFDIISYLYKGYSVVVIWLFAAFVTALLTARDWRGYLVVAAVGAATLLCIVAVIKRPAGTTLVDVAVIFLAFGAMIFTVCERSAVIVRSVIAASCVIIVWVAQAKQPYRQLPALNASKSTADVQWAFFNRVVREAQNRTINYFIPDNYYQHNDVFILLQKGASDFPTWYVTKSGRSLLVAWASISIS